MAFTMYSYFNETTGDLVISGQEETLGEEYAQLSTPSTNPTQASEWPWDFIRSSIKTVKIGTTSPTDMTLMTDMFNGLANATSIDLNGIDTSKVTRLGNMFKGCQSATLLNVSSFNTSNVYIMDSMFYDCSSMSSLDLSSFDTSQVTNINAMFSGCPKLTSLELSSFDTSHVTEMSNMFYNCSSLHIIDIPITATSIVSQLPQDTYYDAATGTSYPKADIPGGSTYVDDLKYTTSISGLMQTRKALNECSKSLNRRISAMKDLGEFEPEDSDRMYMVSSESDSESVDGRKVRRPCILAIVGSDPVRLAFAE